MYTVHITHIHNISFMNYAVRALHHKESYYYNRVGHTIYNQSTICL